MKKTICLTVILLLFQAAVFSQARKQIEYSGFFDSYYYRGPLSITIGAGSAAYMGDLGFLPGNKLYPAFNAGVNYRVWPRTYFGIDLQYLTLGGMKGDTSGYVDFKTNVYEAIAYCRFNLIDKRILFKNDINKRPQRIRPYVILGIGGAYFDPKVTVTDTNFFKKYEAARTSNITLLIPASLGFAFYISKRFSILTEFGYRYAFTHALDGIKKVENGHFDSYATASLKIQYSFHPYKKRRAKYVPPAEGSGTSGGNDAAPVKKDSTLNDPILPPGSPQPEDSLNKSGTPQDSITAPGSGTGNDIIAPPAEEPKPLTEEEKRKKQEEQEQLEWENSSKPKPAPAAPKKKPAAAPKPKPQEDTGGW